MTGILPEKAVNKTVRPLDKYKVQRIFFRKIIRKETIQCLYVMHC